MPPSHYETLGVPRDADAAAIKKAYRKLARENHPDHHPNDTKAAERFKAINRAHEVIGDPEKRRLYDEFGDESEKLGFDAEKARAFRQWGGAGGGGRQGFSGFAGMDVDDLLGGMFGGRARGPRPGRDHHLRIMIDFTTAALGGERTLHVEGDSINVRIPPGIASGGTLRVRGRGAPGPQGGPPGDLRIEVEVAPDPHFTRDGDDLRVEVPVTLGEALRGATVEVPTLTTPLRVKVPPGTQPGRTLRVKGRGVQRPNRPAGDLLVTLKLVLPDITGHEVDAAIDALEALAGDVRADLRSRLGTS